MERSRFIFLCGAPLTGTAALRLVLVFHFKRKGVKYKVGRQKLGMLDILKVLGADPERGSIAVLNLGPGMKKKQSGSGI
jgi:hypothetical protein